MSLKVKFFKMLGELDETEKQQLKQLFDSEESTPQETEAPPIAEDECAVGETDETERTPPIVAKEPPKTAGEEPNASPPVENTAENKPNTKELIAQEPTENAPPAVEENEPVPAMTEETETEEIPAETAPETGPVTDDDGEEMPLDYGAIVDGLNAKIAALEAENIRLRAKTEGAFGYSAKPQGQVKVNPLYDDAKDLHLHR